MNKLAFHKGYTSGFLKQAEPLPDFFNQPITMNNAKPGTSPAVIKQRKANLGELPPVDMSPLASGSNSLEKYDTRPPSPIKAAPGVAPVPKMRFPGSNIASQPAPAVQPAVPPAQPMAPAPPVFKPAPSQIGGIKGVPAPLPSSVNKRPSFDIPAVPVVSEAPITENHQVKKVTPASYQKPPNPTNIPLSPSGYPLEGTPAAERAPLLNQWQQDQAIKGMHSNREQLLKAVEDPKQYDPKGAWKRFQEHEDMMRAKGLLPPKSTRAELDQVGKTSRYPKVQEQIDAGNAAADRVTAGREKPQGRFSPDAPRLASRNNSLPPTGGTETFTGPKQGVTNWNAPKNPTRAISGNGGPSKGPSYTQQDFDKVKDDFSKMPPAQREKIRQANRTGILSDLDAREKEMVSINKSYLKQPPTKIETSAPSMSPSERVAAVRRAREQPTVAKK